MRRAMVLMLVVATVLPSALFAEPPGPEVCPEASAPTAPVHRSESLELKLRDDGSRHGAVIPPFEFWVYSREDVSSRVDMELEIHDPRGKIYKEEFSYSNMRKQCDPICDPVPGQRCGPRECRLERHSPKRHRINHKIYTPPVAGVWTFVLHRLDNGDKVSETRRLFEGGPKGGADLMGEACEMFPLKLGPYTRESCAKGVIPLGTKTNYWGIKARYKYGSCLANAFSMPASNTSRQIVDEGLRALSEAKTFPEGTALRLKVPSSTAYVWLAHHHMYLVAGQLDLPGHEEFLRAFLHVFPNISGPDRKIPACNETRAQFDVQSPKRTLAELTASHPRFTGHYEGNRPAGVRISFHDEHALAAVGLRRGEILHSVNGKRVLRRSEMKAVLEQMTSPGKLEIIVSRERLEHSRCVRLTLSP